LLIGVPALTRARPLGGSPRGFDDGREGLLESRDGVRRPALRVIAVAVGLTVADRRDRRPGLLGDGRHELRERRLAGLGPLDLNRRFGRGIRVDPIGSDGVVAVPRTSVV